MHFRGSSARSSCSLAWASMVGQAATRVPSGPSVAAASKAYFFSASYSTPISFLMATSDRGAPSVDTPAPILLQHCQVAPGLQAAPNANPLRANPFLAVAYVLAQPRDLCFRAAAQISPDNHEHRTL